MAGLMIRRVNMQYVTLAFFFTLCQVIRTTYFHKFLPSPQDLIPHFQFLRSPLGP